jgi:hypothetical protein
MRNKLFSVGVINIMTPAVKSRSKWVTLVTAIALAGCASMPGSDVSDAVKKRASERWSALVRGEFSQAYAYSSPGFRAVVTADGFRNRFGGAVKWVGSEVVKVNCSEPAKCELTVRVDFKPVVSGRAGGEISTHVDETWVLQDGQWWFFQPLK